MTMIADTTAAVELCTEILGHAQAEQHKQLYALAYDLHSLLTTGEDPGVRHVGEDQEITDPWGGGDLVRGSSGELLDINDFYEPFTGWMHVCRICGALVAHHRRKRHRASHGNPSGVGPECGDCGSTEGCMCHSPKR